MYQHAVETVLSCVPLVKLQGMEQDLLFDDPSYQRLPHEIQASTRDDDDYEDPSELLDSSQQRAVFCPASAGPPSRSPPPLLPQVAEEDDIGVLCVIQTLTKPYAPINCMPHPPRGKVGVKGGDLFLFICPRGGAESRYGQTSS